MLQVPTLLADAAPGVSQYLIMQHHKVDSRTALLVNARREEKQDGMKPNEANAGGQKMRDNPRHEYLRYSLLRYLLRQGSRCYLVAAGGPNTCAARGKK